jgi:hypothetical protein
MPVFELFRASLDKKKSLYLPKAWRDQDPTSASQQGGAGKNQPTQAELGRAGARKRHAGNRALKELTLNHFENAGGARKFKSARQAAKAILTATVKAAKDQGLPQISQQNAEVTIAGWIRAAYPAHYRTKK